MDLIKLIEQLKNGAIITIEKKGYTPTSFRYFDNKILYKNKEITGCGWCEHTSNLEEIKQHFEKMINEKYTIKIEMVWRN